MKNVRIMIFNAGYLTGMSGRPREYLTKGARLILPYSEERFALSSALIELIEQTKPDILFLAEIRNGAYMEPIKKLFHSSYIDSKYAPKSILHLVPFFHGNCNGVFLSRSFPVTQVYMKHGAKRLVYKVVVSETCSVVFAHLALGRRVRQKQFRELANLAVSTHQTIVAGDFNIFHGAAELAEVCDTAGLHIVSDLSQKTFPSYGPKHCIDVFLATPSLRVKSITVLPNIGISDHLPVVADFEIDA